MLIILCRNVAYLKRNDSFDDHGFFGRLVVGKCTKKRVCRDR